MLSLKDAIEQSRLPEFIKQEEKRGIGPVSERGLLTALSNLIRQPRSEDQTSR
jgi:hypothetical protein